MFKIQTNYDLDTIWFYVFFFSSLSHKIRRTLKRITRWKFTILIVLVFVIVKCDIWTLFSHTNCMQNVFLSYYVTFMISLVEVIFSLISPFAWWFYGLKYIFCLVSCVTSDLVSSREQYDYWFLLADISSESHIWFEESYEKANFLINFLFEILL